MMINGVLGCDGEKAVEACSEVPFRISVVWSKGGSRNIGKDIQSADQT
jgi:hypothetical protein